MNFGTGKGLHYGLSKAHLGVQLKSVKYIPSASNQKRCAKSLDQVESCPLQSEIHDLGVEAVGLSAASHY